MLSLLCSWRKLIVREVKWSFQGQRRAGAAVCCTSPGAKPSCRSIYHLGAELGLIFSWQPGCVGFACVFCKISPGGSGTSFPGQVVSPRSSTLALCSALGLHNSFHKYLLRNMTRCQKRPKAARKSPAKTIITHLRFFFFFLQ